MDEAKYQIGQDEYEKFKKHEASTKNRKAVAKAERMRKKLQYAWLKPSVLAAALSQGTLGHSWAAERSLKGMEHVDVAGEYGNYTIFVEIEGGQSAPVNNVVKIWRYADKNYDIKPILLIQIFSPYYEKGVHNTRMEQAIFVGEHADKANNKITYRYLRPKDWPSGNTALGTLLGRLGKLITPAA